jgi:ATP synthase F1 delta subunit
MKQSRLANRYAKALLKLALEEKKLDQIGADMALISETIDENKELENMLKSPVIKLEKKEKVMRQVFGKKTNPNQFCVLCYWLPKRAEKSILLILPKSLPKYSKIIRAYRCLAYYILPDRRRNQNFNTGVAQ